MKANDNANAQCRPSLIESQEMPSKNGWLTKSSMPDRPSRCSGVVIRCNMSSLATADTSGTSSGNRRLFLQTHIGTYVTKIHKWANGSFYKHVLKANLLISTLDRQYTGSNSPSITSLVLDEERIRPGHWLWITALCSSSALKSLVAWQEGHLVVKHPRHLSS